MQRPIRFRIRNTKTNEWIHGPGNEVNLFGETIIFGELLYGISIEDLNEIRALQFSGEQDKDSKEVYEGDIVRLQMNNDPEDLQWEVGVIQFVKGSFTFVSKYENENLHDFFVNGKLDFEVIGNIFDNSNLIPE